MKKVTLSIMAALALVSFTPATYAAGYPTVFADNDDDEEEGNGSGPGGGSCGQGFQLDQQSGLCVPV